MGDETERDDRPTTSDPEPTAKIVPLARPHPRRAGSWVPQMDASATPERPFPPYDPIAAAQAGFLPVRMESRNVELGPIVLDAVGRTMPDGNVLLLAGSCRIRVYYDADAPVPIRLEGAKRARAILANVIDRKISDGMDGWSRFSDDLVDAAYRALCEGWGEEIEATAKTEEEEDRVDLDRLRRLARGEEA